MLCRALAWVLAFALGVWFAWLIGQFLGLIFLYYGPDLSLH